MKRTAAIMLGMILCSAPAVADEGGSLSQASKDAGAKISGFLKRLNPMPFLKEQEKRYNERKGAAR